MPVYAEIIVHLVRPISDDALEVIREEMRIAAKLWTPSGTVEFRETGPLCRITDTYPRVWLWDDIVAATGCWCDRPQWLDVNLSETVYLPGYERGYLPLFIRAAEWLETMFPACEVWYGEDSNSSFLPFGPEERELFVAFYRQYGDRPYMDKQLRTPEWKQAVEDIHLELERRRHAKYR